MSNLLFILLYGVVGTIISMTLFVLGLSALENFFKHDSKLQLNAYHMLLLANFLSNWETHSCILILEEKDYPTLTSLMFGETMVNEAVVIALYNTIKSQEKSLIHLDNITTQAYIDVGEQLLKVGSLSILIGIAVSLTMCFVMRRMREFIYDNAYLQMMLVLVAGYLSFMLSEIAEYAGAVTIFCAGFVLSYYACQSMSEKGQTLTKVTVHFLGFLPESFIFAYIGLHVAYNFVASMNELIWLAAVVAGSFYIRALSIYALHFLGSLLRCKCDSRSFKSTTMLVLGGMIRGKLR